MELIAMSNKSKGFTLVEVLVSMVILTILLLGLLGAFAKAIDINVRNYLRDEATKIAQAKLEEYRNKGFDNVIAENGTVQVQFRNKNYTYNFDSSVDDFGDFKRVVLSINWNYKGRTYNYSLYTAVRKD